MFKWGKEEQETIEKLEKINLKGRILNLAAGDGRFNEYILKLAENVIAVDINKEDLMKLESNCPQYLKDRLEIKCIDITKRLPFEDNTFDGVFCTGTLHLFDLETINSILEEIERILKHEGKILFDFATDIIRIDKNGKKVILDGEGNYSLKEGVKIFYDKLKHFNIEIEQSKFKEGDLDEESGYKFIEGKFLIVSGMCKKN